MIDEKTCTPARVWARKRNFALRRLKCMKANVQSLSKSDVLVGSEYFSLELIEYHLKRLCENYKSHNSESKENNV